MFEALNSNSRYKRKIAFVLIKNKTIFSNKTKEIAMVDKTPGSTADWPTFSLANVVTEAEVSREEGKYLFIWDK